MKENNNMDLSEQLQKMSGRPVSKKVTIEFSIDELALIAGAMKCITDTNKRSKKEFFDMTKGTVGRLQASMIFVKIIAKCEKDFRERAEQLINANEETE